MRTPAGTECALYYEDFHRGREIRECRARRAEGSERWTPAACSSCPVPGILKANSDPALQLTFRSGRKGLLGFLGKGRTTVEAWCTRHGIPVEDPYAGCPECGEAARKLLEDL
jgi:hypothetical protein